MTNGKTPPQRQGHHDSRPGANATPDVNAAIAQAVALHRSGRLAEAQARYREILRAVPDHPDVPYLLGVTEAQSGRHAEAERLIRQSLARNPRSAPAHSDLGNVLSALERHDEALASFDKALELKPDYPEPHLNRGNVLLKLARYPEAIASYDRAIAIQPGHAGAHYNRGVALLRLGQLEAAVASFDKALSLAPFQATALALRAEALLGLRRYDDAITSCDRALALKSDLPGAWLTRGRALQALRRSEEALAACRNALTANPNLADAWLGCGIAAYDLKRYDEAIAACDKAVALAGPAYAKGLRLHAKMHACDWNGFEDESAQLLADLRAGRPVAPPFLILPIASTATDQLSCARNYTAERYPASATPLWRGERYAHRRVRIAYVSSDFYDHAVAYLVAGLFEHHDKTRFETTAISFGPDRDVEVRRRIRNSFDRFIDARQWTDEKIAQHLRAAEIDIAIDMNGITGEARPGIFARRPAPIQVNFLGCPATTGADYIDYIVADRIVIPEDQQEFYTEKVVYLPESYQANDSKRRISERVPSRAEAGLPERGFVFCAFNNNFKITPEVFAVWMRLLRDVASSALWLFEGNPIAPANLRRHAEAHGIAAERLIFAPRVELPDHLARHRLADLFLDTLHYNGHTTVSDALWAGVPVVTRIGTTFAGRAGASLLSAVGLPELVTHSLDEYEALALKLARDEAALAQLKHTLGRRRGSHPLFDTARYTKHLEAAYTGMCERYQRGEPPAGFAVAAIGRA
jgi:predicted O-linked N-acetylglucosamine transferase (SPINDLY family)